MSHRRVYRLFTLWISLLSRLVPRSHRDRWAEERRSDATLRAPTTGAVDRIRQDLRFAARGVRRQPAFAAVAILTLAFGIGINAAMFSIVRAVLLKPLPFADAHELVQVWETRLSQGRDRNVVSYPDFVDWRDQNQVFDAMAAYRGVAANASGTDRAERLLGAAVTHDFFDVLHSVPSSNAGPISWNAFLGKPADRAQCHPNMF